MSAVGKRRGIHNKKALPSVDRNALKYNGGEGESLTAPLSNDLHPIDLCKFFLVGMQGSYSLRFLLVEL